MRISSAIGRRLSRPRPAAGLVFVHHRVGEQPGDEERELVPALATHHFEERLGLLAERYRVVPVRQVLDAARARRRGEPVPVALTFDDDLDSHLDVVAPSLLRWGFPATFFVGPPLPSGAAFWWEDLQALADDGRLPPRLDSLPEADLMPVTRRERGAIRDLGLRIESLPPDRRDAVAAELHSLAGSSTRRRLDAEAMAALVDLGFELGFHTARHYVLTTVDHDRLTRELTDGRDVLESIANGPITIIAYPHGKADPQVAQAARAVGFEVGFITGHARIHKRTDPLFVPRVEVHNAPLDHFEKSLAWALTRNGR